MKFTANQCHFPCLWYQSRLLMLSWTLSLLKVMESITLLRVQMTMHSKFFSALPASDRFYMQNLSGMLCLGCFFCVVTVGLPCTLLFNIASSGEINYYSVLCWSFIAYYECATSYTGATFA